jgi:hypothetical protein
MVNNVLLQLNKLNSEVASFTDSSEKELMFHGVKIKANTVDGASKLLEAVDNEILKLLRYSSCINSPELCPIIREILDKCEAIVDDRTHSQGIFSRIFQGGSKEILRSRFQDLKQTSKLLDLFAQFQEERLPEYTAEQNQVQDDLRNRLSALAEQNPLVARKIVHAQSNDFNSAIRKVWKQAKELSVHHILDEMSADLSRTPKEGEDESKVTERLKSALMNKEKLFSALDRYNPSSGDTQKLISTLANVKKQYALALVFLAKHVPKSEYETLVKAHANRQDALDGFMGVLRNAHAIPTRIEDLEHYTDDPAIDSFCRSLGQLYKKNPFSAKKLLRKIAKQSNNAVLQRLAESETTLTFDGVPIDIRYVEAFARAIPSVEKVEYGKLTGDRSRLDLLRCHPSVCKQLLEACAEELTDLRLPADFIHKKEFMELCPGTILEHSSWTDKPSEKKDYYIKEEYPSKFAHLEHLRLVASSEKPTMNLSIFELEVLVLMFPGAHDVHLPPIELEGFRGHSPQSMDLKVFGVFSLGAMGFIERVPLQFATAILKSCIQSGSCSHNGTAGLFDYHPAMGTAMNIAIQLTMGMELNLEDLDPSIFSETVWQELISLTAGSGHLASLKFPKDMRFCTFDLSNNPLIDDTLLKEFLENNHDAIYRLKLDHSPNITDEGVGEILQQSSHLSHLDLSHNPQITDAAFRDLGDEEISRLRVLDLRGTAVSLECAAELREKNEMLRVLVDEKAHQARNLLEKRHSIPADQKAYLIIGGRTETIHRGVLTHSLQTLMDRRSKLTLAVSISQKASDGLIYYLYHGQLPPLDEDSLFELMSLAMDPAVKDTSLIADCEQYLIRTCSKENALARYQKAKNLNMQGVADGVYKFLLATSPSSEALASHGPLKPKQTEKASYSLPLVPESDVKFILRGVAGRKKVEVKANRFNLMRRSAALEKILEKNGKAEILIESARPEAFVRIVEALNEDRVLSFKGLKTREVLDLIKQADRLGVVNAVISLKELHESFFGVSGKEIDSSWIDLLDWAKENHQSPIGFEAVMQFHGAFTPEKIEELKVSNPEKAHRVLAVMTSDSYNYYRSLWVKHAQTRAVLDFFASGE